MEWSNFKAHFSKEMRKNRKRNRTVLANAATPHNDIVCSFNEPVNVKVLPGIVILFIFIFNNSDNDIATKQNIYYV